MLEMLSWVNEYPHPIFDMVSCDYYKNAPRIQKIALAVHWQFSILTLFKCIGISELLEVGKAGNFAGDVKGCVRLKD